ncbi:unnamed protein product [Rotaria sp. Silwood2]|nr:unnamed protein product [Rotaria sp. Silwood2]
MARGDRYRRGYPVDGGHLGGRRCARALRRAVPAGADRADRRAGSADGWRSRHQSLRRSHDTRAQQNLPGIAHPARRAGGHDPEAEHGHLRQKIEDPG